MIAYNFFFDVHLDLVAACTVDLLVLASYMYPVPVDLLLLVASWIYLPACRYPARSSYRVDLDTCTEYW